MANKYQKPAVILALTAGLAGVTGFIRGDLPDYEVDPVDYRNRCQQFGLNDNCDYMMGNADDSVVRRNKRYQIMSGGPLNGRLHEDKGDKVYEDVDPAGNPVKYAIFDNIMAVLSCQAHGQNVNDAPGKIARYYFNGMRDDDIMFKYNQGFQRTDPDQPIYRDEQQCTGGLMKPRLDEMDAFGNPLHPNRIPEIGQADVPYMMTYAQHQGNTYPVDSNGFVIPDFPNERLGQPDPAGTCDKGRFHANYANNHEQEFTEGHYVTCEAHEHLVIKLYDYSDPDNLGQHLNGWVVPQQQTACMADGDIIRSTANYGRRDGAIQGNEICFNNRNPKYELDPNDPNFNRDLPWHPWHNCYAAEQLQGEPLSPFTFTDCEKDAMQLFIKVDDLEDQPPNTPWPMRQESLFLQASLTEVFNDLAIFAADIMRVDFYVQSEGTQAKPQSFVLSPRDYEALCRQYEAADEIECTNFNVQCTHWSDEIVLRVSGGGELQMDTFACGELLEGMSSYTDTYGVIHDMTSMTLEQRWNTLSTDAATLSATGKLPGSGPTNQYNHDALRHRVGITPRFAPNALVKWHYDTYTTSSEPRCYPGDTWKFGIPHCELKKEDVIVPSTPFFANDLWMSDNQLNKCFSGFPGYREAPAEDIEPEKDLAARITVPDHHQSGTYWDFKQYQETSGFNGLVSLDELPECGTLSVAEGDSNLDLNQAVLEDAVINEIYDMNTHSFVFDSDGCGAQVQAPQFVTTPQVSIPGTSPAIQQCLGSDTCGKTSSGQSGQEEPEQCTIRQNFWCWLFNLFFWWM